MNMAQEKSLQRNMCGVKRVESHSTMNDKDFQDGQEVVYYTVKPLPEEGKKRIAKRITDYVQREINKTDLNDEN